ncbi:MAG: amidohydrolase family protein [Clostridiales bacterium]|nr:amidohydrolase family protein [Clostridiales bacterium]
MIDGHIHMMDKTDKDSFIKRIGDANLYGGVVLSLPPRTFSSEYNYSFQQRSELLLELTEGDNGLIPFFWIDPLENDAQEQVDEAVALGVKGFKIMCIDDYPHHPKAMEVYKRIARHGKPILFHSGILWNDKNSSEFNRPAYFECMLAVEGIRFALAHMSWPWIDECLAVYGKFLRTRAMGLDQQMYIDLTPGTPEIYRREALTKLITIGYDVEDRVFWGSDNMTNDYDVGWCRRWQEIDEEILNDLKVTKEQVDKIKKLNLLRFIG